MIDPIKGFESTLYVPSTVEKKNDIQLVSKQVQNNNQSSYYNTSNTGTCNYTQEVPQKTTKNDWDRLETQILKGEIQIKAMARSGYNVENLTSDEINTIAYAMERSSNQEGIGQTNSSRVEKYGEKVDQLLNKIKRLKEHEDSMYTYAMGQKGSLTINSLYKASFSGANKKQGGTYNTSDMTKLLGQNNIEQTQGNMWAANKLMALGLDVTGQDVVKIQNIQTAVDGLSEYDEAEKASKALEQGGKIGESPLLEDEKILYSEKDIQDIVDEISQVDEEDISNVLSQGKEVTIGNLKEAMYKNTQSVLKKTSSEATPITSNKINESELVTQGGTETILKGKEQVQQTLKDMTSRQGESGNKDQNSQEKVEQVKAQINEIRARLNVEAAQKLSTRMPLESTELAKVAEALIHIEEEQVQEAMKKVDLSPTEENKERIKDVIHATHSIAVHKDIAAEVSLTTNETATLEECQSAITAYEENFSVAEKRFGETTAKVTKQIESFLKEHNLPQDANTIEAAKALIASGMELNEENLNAATQVVMKINTLLEEMTPYRAAALIKEGLNPYKASVNAILNWVEVERLPQLKNSIAETIVALEDKHQITEEQKQGMIGLYKILARVEKSKDDVAGYLLKNNMPLTIEKLEEATKYIGKKSYIEKRIDDKFGTLEELKYDKQTARQMIYESKEENEKLAQLAKILENIQLPVTEENKDKLSKLQSIIYPFIKESVKKELGKFEGLDTLPPSLTQKIEALKNVNPELIQVMEKQSIKVTIANIYWMQKMVENPGVYGELLSEQNLAHEGFPKSFKDIEQNLKDLEKKAKESKNEAIQTGDMTTYRSYKQIEEMVNVQKELTQKDGVYQIPFVIEGETKLVQMYINKENGKKDIKKDGMNMVIAYDTKNMGTITAAIHLKGNNVSYAISTSSGEASEALSSMRKDLQKMLDQIGYNIQKEDYHSEKEEVVVHPSQVLKRGESYFEEIV